MEALTLSSSDTTPQNGIHGDWRASEDQHDINFDLPLNAPPVPTPHSYSINGRTTAAQSPPQASRPRPLTRLQAPRTEIRPTLRNPESMGNSDFHGRIPSLTAEQLSHLPALRLVVTSSTGVNHIDLRECRRRGIAAANSGNVYAEDVADTAVGLLIDVLRRISAADRYVRSGLWPVKVEYPLGSKLAGKRVGIISLGNIGLEVAKRLEAFGCIICYNSRKKKPSVPFTFYLDVCDLAANCDILVICCALTDKTHHMINKEVLLALGKEGVVVNIARGAVIDEKAFVQCLVQGDIAGAGLDVFEREPNVPKDLLELENVVLSPHRAVFTAESFWDCFEYISGNLKAFFSNKPLLSPVVEE
ncbi:hypothetical protein RJ639_039262 [Escallonia herrerae]|uniref:Glyoxylate/hydroxypyruvate reductase HPR3-like n=1 Tax=Escallonia herrerae TaxID=1293975 RepID=A0AA88WIQ8_9ASTE|nr:hypothetical protein RJ639_039262 [Escallonia herrerae]